CILVTKTASHLQNMHFGYKSGVSFTNIQLSVTKVAFQFTKWHLVLLLSSRVTIELEKKGLFNKNDKNIKNNDK
ncbi:MAG: hypothetical protein E6917_15735, partial [Clostridium botulinum]|nr:hypothetical protein [Clostridium botulinum]